jgi:DNA-directed RNA polymerase specialized sigma24 family protein
MTMEITNPGETIWSEQQRFISKTARDLSRSFNRVVDEEDLLQEAWVFCWEKEAYFFENNCRDVYVRKSIYNVMMNYALKMRHQTLRQTDTFFYSADEVRELLPTFLDSYEVWTVSPVPAGAETMTKNDNVEVFLDFSLAWDRLTDTQKNILQRRYEDAEEGFDANERKALSRATNRFIDLLNQKKDQENKSYDGPGAYLTNPEAPKRVSSSAAGLKAVSLDD